MIISELVWKQGCVLQADEGGKARESINYMYHSVSGLEIYRALCSDLLFLIEVKVALQAGRSFSMMPTALCALESQWVWKGSQKHISIGKPWRHLYPSHKVNLFGQLLKHFGPGTARFSESAFRRCGL